MPNNNNNNNKNNYLYTDPNPVGAFVFGYNQVCCYQPFTYRPDHGRGGGTPPAAALDTVRLHLGTARPIILSHRNTFQSVFHVYDSAVPALQHEWVPRVNHDLQSHGYQVEARTQICGSNRQNNRRQLLAICLRRILPPNHPSLAPEKHIGELPTRRKTTEERIRDIQRAIRE